MERLAAGGSATRPPRPARCSTSSSARRRPAMPRRAGRVFADLKERYPRTAYAQQGGLLAAKLQFDKGQADAARATLAWVDEHAVEDEYQHARAPAPGRPAARCQAVRRGAEAARRPCPQGPFEALVADRRGDVLLAQGKKDEARAAYQRGYKPMDDKARLPPPGRCQAHRAGRLGRRRRRLRPHPGPSPMTLRATPVAGCVGGRWRLRCCWRAAARSREAQADAAGADRRPS